MGAGRSSHGPRASAVANIASQEGWLAENAVSMEDKLAAERARSGADRPDDPMQGLEGLDVAGPKPA